MTVLLVDDQIHILSGLISGLDWNALGVTSILTAESARKAREILEREPVDILLCDIEMPRENGLSLLRWARAQGMEFVCVFLTSHADFLYAQEAMQLNCFDYILQPARYSDIQATVAKAIRRVQNRNTERKLAQYGNFAQKNSASLFQSLFSGWISGKGLSVPDLCGALSALGTELTPETDCFIIWGQLLRWHGEPWSSQDWEYALNNMLTEVYEAKGFGILPFAIDSLSLGWFVFAKEGRFPDPEAVLAPLNQGYLAAAEYFPSDFAFYVTQAVPLKELNAQAGRLCSAKQDNIRLKSGIFCPLTQPNQVRIIRFLDSSQLRRWENLLKDGCGQTVCKEAGRYLDAMAEEKNMRFDDLRSFWIQFQKTVLDAAQAVGLDLPALFPDLDRGHSAASLDELHTAIQRVTERFGQKDGPDETPEGLVKQAESYIDNNVDRVMNVSEVAAAFYVNADHLSRVFRAQRGIPLKEYIIRRKMQSAQTLLTTTNLPIGVIASKLGYDNFSYFSQLYRKVMGISPTEERKEK